MANLYITANCDTEKADAQTRLRELEDENFWLREELGLYEQDRLSFQSALRVRRQSAIVLGQLARRGYLRRDTLRDLLVAAGSKGTSRSLAGVVVFKAREAVRDLGVTIENVWGEGWVVSPENRARLLQIIQDQVKEAA